MGRPWTEGEIARLRTLCPVYLCAEVGRRLGRHPSNIRAKAKSLGIQWKREHETYHRYNQEEDGLIREMWPDVPVADIAVALGLDASSVWDRASRIGLKRQGSSLLNDAAREARIAGSRRGVKAATAKRIDGLKAFATQNGWPEDMMPHQVAILNLLARECQNGSYVTRRQMAKACCCHPKSICGRAIPDLLKRGLMMAMPNPVRRSKSDPRTLYAIGPVARIILEERRSCEKDAEAR